MVWVSDEYLVVTPARRMFDDAKGIMQELLSVHARTGRERWLRLSTDPSPGMSPMNCPNAMGELKPVSTSAEAGSVAVSVRLPSDTVNEEMEPLRLAT